MIIRCVLSTFDIALIFLFCECIIFDINRKKQRNNKDNEMNPNKEERLNDNQNQENQEDGIRRKENESLINTDYNSEILKFSKSRI